MKLQLALGGLSLTCELRRDPVSVRDLGWLANPSRARLRRRLWRRFSRAWSTPPRTAA